MSPAWVSFGRHIEELRHLEERGEIVSSASDFAQKLGFKYWHLVPLVTPGQTKIANAIGNFPRYIYETNIENELEQFPNFINLIQQHNEAIDSNDLARNPATKDEIKKYAAMIGGKDPFLVGVPIHLSAGYFGYALWTATKREDLSENCKDILGAYSYLLHKKLLPHLPVWEKAGEIPLRISPRQKTVLLHVLQGCSNLGIANNMGISENTVRFHIKKLCADFGMDSRIKVAITALEAGLLR